MALVIVQSKGKVGRINLKASADDLLPAPVVIDAR